VRFADACGVSCRVRAGSGRRPTRRGRRDSPQVCRVPRPAIDLAGSARRVGRGLRGLARSIIWATTATL
ncbi:MAG: hypothetical protein AVDCRST_MAG18-2365, partial [uncultured Thermomicrobiales bacterium]